MTDINKPRRTRQITREAALDSAIALVPKVQTPPATPSPMPSAKPQSKIAQVLVLLGHPDGATLDQLVNATGWLPHTTRAALTGLRKKGHAVVSEKPGNGPRVYRVAEAA